MKKSFEKIVSAVRAVIGMGNPTVFCKKDGTEWLVVAMADDSAELVIEGSIGESFYDESGTSSKQYRSALATIPKNKPINLRINSPGGAVGDALSIYNQNKERGNVTTHIDGYALSSASVIALSGVKCVMPKSAIMMIHDPLSYTYGNEEEHRKAAKMLATHAETMAQIYSEKSGMTPAECRELMKAECWMSGEDANEKGFTDEIGEDPDEDATAQAKVSALDLSQFKNVPQAVMAMAQPISAANPVADPPAPPPAVQTKPENSMQPPTVPAAAAPPATPQTPTAPDVVSRAEFDAMKQQMLDQKKARIESRIDTLIGEQKVSNDERQAEIDLCMANESRLETVLAKRTSQFHAGEPLGPGPTIEVNGTFLDRIRDMKAAAPASLIGGDATMSALARYEYRKNNWGEMLYQAKAMDQRAGSADAPRLGALGSRMVMSNPQVKFCTLDVQPDGSARYLPVAASSYAASLIVDQLADGAITQLVATLAPLRVFTRDFMPSPFMPLNTLQVRLVTQGGQQIKTPKSTGSGITTTQTDYEASGDHTVNNVAITMNEYSMAFQVGPQELMSGMRIEYLANHALESLGSNILSDTLVLFNSGNFTAGPLGGSFTAHYGTWTWNSASSTVNDMAVARAQLGKSGTKNAVLDPVLFSKLITIPVANQMQVGMPLANANTMRNIMGWNEIAETTAWATGQGAGGSTASYPQPIIGVVCHPQAVAVGARLPIVPPEGIPGNTLVMSQVTIPGLDMTVAIFSWFSLRYRTLWNSYGIVYGASAGDLTAAAVIKSLGV